MIITNVLGLPDVLVKACSNQRKPSKDSISTTELIDSPLIHRLKLQHWEHLEADVSEMVWAMTGTALHQMVEKHGVGTAEIALSTEFEGYHLTGTCDHLTPDLISDWKTTSVWSVMLGNDWIHKVEQQLNIYRWLHWRMSGQLVQKLSAVVIFRDWRRSELKRNPEQYPPRNIMEIPVRPWPLDEAEGFVRERLGYHHDANYICTLEERWAKPTSYAVKKPGALKAVRVFETLEQAMKMQQDNPQYDIETRPGEHLRCAEFCPVRDVCQYKVNPELRL